MARPGGAGIRRPGRWLAADPEMDDGLALVAIQAGITALFLVAGR